MNRVILVENIRFYNPRKLDQAKQNVKDGDIQDIVKEYQRLGGLYEEISGSNTDLPVKPKKRASKNTKKVAKKAA